MSNITIINRQGQFTIDSREVTEIDPSLYGGFMGCVYAVEYGNSIKIGCTKDPIKRIKTVISQGKNYSSVTCSRVAVSLPHTNYKENETIIHKHFSDKRVTGGELFNLSIDEFIRQCPKLVFKDDSAEKERRSSENFEKLKSFILGG